MSRSSCRQKVHTLGSALYQYLDRSQHSGFGIAAAFVASGVAILCCWFHSLSCCHSLQRGGQTFTLLALPQYLNLVQGLVLSLLQVQLQLQLEESLYTIGNPDAC